MSYVVFAERRLVAVCDKLPEAVSLMPKGSKDTHIFDENKGEVFFFKKGKLNGQIENKK